MIFTMCFSENKNVMGNSYQDIVNAFPDKKNIICMIPSGYNINDFSNDFTFKYKENISIKIRGFWLKKQFIFLYKVFKFIQKYNQLKKFYNIDTIFIYPDNRAIYPILSFFLNNVKIFTWVHDPILHDGEKFSKRLIRFFNKFTLFKKTSHFIVSYNNAKNELYINYNINKNKISTIFLPRLKSMEFNDIKNEIFPIKYDFIFYGRLEKYKGINLLLEAFSDKNLKNISLLIIGGVGNEKKYVYNKTKNMPNVTFLNKYISDKDLAKYIMQSHFVILPYKTATGTQTIQIANYYNKFVLVTKTGCFLDYVSDKQNGFFINNFTTKDIKNTILYVLNQKFDKKHIQNCLKKFDIQSTSNKIYKLLTKENLL